VTRYLVVLSIGDIKTKTHRNWSSSLNVKMKQTDKVTFVFILDVGMYLHFLEMDNYVVIYDYIHKR
jgi:hypothetical protein